MLLCVQAWGHSPVHLAADVQLQARLSKLTVSWLQALSSHVDRVDGGAVRVNDDDSEGHQLAPAASVNVLPHWPHTEASREYYPQVQEETDNLVGTICRAFPVIREKLEVQAGLTSASFTDMPDNATRGKAALKHINHLRLADSVRSEMVSVMQKWMVRSHTCRCPD
jgi:hypothetical protein